MWPNKRWSTDLEHEALQEENRRNCYDDGYEDGKDNPYDHTPWSAFHVMHKKIDLSPVLLADYKFELILCLERKHMKTYENIWKH